MWIFGYDESKQVIEVDLPMETVLSLGIDPWRLDLFDPDPITCEVGNGVSLSFRKLRDLAFAYRVDETTFVCVNDGSQTVCLNCRTRDFDGKTVRADNLRRS